MSRLWISKRIGKSYFVIHNYLFLSFWYIFSQRIGVVTQDPTLFSGTILSNITYGVPDATLEQAVEAAKRANAHDFITSFPDGYETEVGER